MDKLMDLEKEIKRAVAIVLGINPSYILELHHYPGEKRLMVLVNIFYSKDEQKFVKDYNPPFLPGDKVVPMTTPVFPRGGTKNDGLTDKRKRTVEKVWFDLNTRTWWIYLRGKKFPFTPNVFNLAPPRS